MIEHDYGASIEYVYKAKRLTPTSLKGRNKMKTVNVVAAIICKDNKIFATQRGHGEFKGGWEFPGGKVEPGETPEEALIREIKEELDSEIKVEKYIHTVEYDYPAFHLSMRCYLCSLVSGDLVLTEHEAAMWLKREELRSVSWLPADLELIPVIEEYIK